MRSSGTAFLLTVAVACAVAVVAAPIGSARSQQVHSTGCTMVGMISFSPALTNTLTLTTVKLKWSWTSCNGSAHGITAGRTAHPTDLAHRTASIDCTTVTAGLPALNLGGKQTWTPVAQSYNNFSLAAGMRLFGAGWPRSFSGTFTGGPGPATGAYTGHFTAPTAPCVAGVATKSFTGNVRFYS